MNRRFLIGSLIPACIAALPAAAQSPGPVRLPVKDYIDRIGPNGTVIFTDPRGTEQRITIHVPPQKKHVDIDGLVFADEKPTHMFSEVTPKDGLVVTMRVENASLTKGAARFQEWRINVATGHVWFPHAIDDLKNLRTMEGSFTRS